MREQRHDDLPEKPDGILCEVGSERISKCVLHSVFGKQCVERQQRASPAADRSLGSSCGVGANARLEKVGGTLFRNVRNRWLHKACFRKCSTDSLLGLNLKSGAGAARAEAGDVTARRGKGESVAERKNAAATSRLCRSEAEALRGEVKGGFPCVPDAEKMTTDEGQSSRWPGVSVVIRRRGLLRLAVNERTWRRKERSLSGESDGASCSVSRPRP